MDIPDAFIVKLNNGEVSHGVSCRECGCIIRHQADRHRCPVGDDEGFVEDDQEEPQNPSVVQIVAVLTNGVYRWRKMDEKKEEEKKEETEEKEKQTEKKEE